MSLRRVLRLASGWGRSRRAFCATVTTCASAWRDSASNSSAWSRLPRRSQQNRRVVGQTSSLPGWGGGARTLVIVADALIEDPRCPRAALTGRRTTPRPPELVDDRLHERLVHVRRISDRVHNLPAAAHDDDIDIGEHGSGDRAGRAGQQQLVRLFSGVEVPDAGANDPVVAFECRGGDIFRGIPSTGIRGNAGNLTDRPEEKIDEVETVRRQVEEQAAAGDRRIEPPV